MGPSSGQHTQGVLRQAMCSTWLQTRREDAQQMWGVVALWWQKCEFYAEPCDSAPGTSQGCVHDRVCVDGLHCTARTPACSSMCMNGSGSLTGSHTCIPSPSGSCRWNTRALCKRHPRLLLIPCSAQAPGDCAPQGLCGKRCPSGSVWQKVPLRVCVTEGSPQRFVWQKVPLRVCVAKGAPQGLWGKRCPSGSVWQKVPLRACEAKGAPQGLCGKRCPCC